MTCHLTKKKLHTHVLYSSFNTGAALTAGTKTYYVQNTYVFCYTETGTSWLHCSDVNEKKKSIQVAVPQIGLRPDLEKWCSSLTSRSPETANRM